MKITDIRTYILGNPWKNWLFVQMDTDEGIIGLGEGTLNGFAKTVEAAIHELKHLVIGTSPFDVETIGLKLLRDVYSDGGQIQGSALAAIETAFWDIMGKAVNQPLYKLLGGRCHDKSAVLCQRLVSRSKVAGTFLRENESRMKLAG
ncbi:hypothetical protein [Paenibacillus sp. HJGM_3]|uniref:hypothetical protein n=1 Tax=Paenibacillus sp. HJGM_3 TaxID=3379816 RepID=UPI00385954EB